MLFEHNDLDRQISEAAQDLISSRFSHPLPSGISMRAFTVALASLLLHMPTDQASAATATSTFTVQITIGAACVVTSTTMDFGSAGVLAAAVDQSSTINVQCTTGLPYTVALNSGLHGGSVSTRQMRNGAVPINYSLSRDVGRLQNWGETSGTDTVGGTGNGAVQPLTVYGRVPAQTTPAPGVYSDTVTVTVTY
jgi:spore coat protein U-like protein